MELITRRVIKELEGCDPDRATLEEYADPDSEKYRKMVEKIGEKLHFTSLHYHRLDDMMESVGIDADCLCTYCWTAKNNDKKHGKSIFDLRQNLQRQRLLYPAAQGKRTRCGALLR